MSSNAGLVAGAANDLIAYVRHWNKAHDEQISCFSFQLTADNEHLFPVVESCHVSYRSIYPKQGRKS